MQAQLQRWREQILAAVAAGQALTLRGGGSKDFYGESVRTEAVLDTRSHHGIVAYDAAELVITARCGTPLAEVEAALAERGQMLAFEPPHFGPTATIGGCVAAGLAGPRRPHAGSVRDFVLGVRLLNGRGEDLQFGGQVMKNVAGYDVSRLLTGSLGTLGVLTEVSLKVLPQAPATATVWFECEQTQALAWLNQWMGQPLPLSGSLWHGGRLWLRLSGATAAVAAALGHLAGQRLPETEAEAFWQALREQQLPFFSQSDDPRPLWRLAVPDTTAPLAVPADAAELVEWGGGLRWWRSSADAAEIRALAAAAGGHATLFRGRPAPGVPVFTPLAPVNWAIQQRLKQAFDPAGVFNPGRMYAAV